MKQVSRMRTRQWGLLSCRTQIEIRGRRKGSRFDWKEQSRGLMPSQPGKTQTMIVKTVVEVDRVVVNECVTVTLVVAFLQAGVDAGVA
jgi:hypothetical protein